MMVTHAIPAASLPYPFRKRHLGPRADLLERLALGPFRRIVGVNAIEDARREGSCAFGWPGVVWVFPSVGLVALFVSSSVLNTAPTELAVT